MISDGKRVNDGVEINGKWMHIENDIDGNMSSNYSGWSVGMSSDDRSSLELLAMMWPIDQMYHTTSKCCAVYIFY